jgi:hypothetical protein
MQSKGRFSRGGPVHAVIIRRGWVSVICHPIAQPRLEKYFTPSEGDVECKVCIAAIAKAKQSEVRTNEDS